MLDIRPNYISAESYKKYNQAVKAVLEAVYVPYDGKNEEEKEYYSFWCNSSKEDLQEAIDFLNELKEFLPTDEELYGEVKKYGD